MSIRVRSSSLLSSRIVLGRVCLAASMSWSAACPELDPRADQEADGGSAPVDVGDVDVGTEEPSQGADAGDEAPNEPEVDAGEDVAPMDDAGMAPEPETDAGACVPGQYLACTEQDEVRRFDACSGTSEPVEEDTYSCVHDATRGRLVAGPYMDLSGITGLSETSLEGYSLEATQFLNAHLAGVSFANANLSYAKLDGATLEGASFERSLARFASFANAHGAASFEHADLGSARFADAALSSSLFASAKLEGTDFARAKLEDADMRWTRLDRVSFQGADLDDVNLAQALGARPSFYEASLRNANLSFVSLSPDQAHFSCA